MDLRSFWKWNNRTKNILVSTIGMCLCVMAIVPAVAVQNIALAESTDIDLNVGYHTAIINSVASILSGFIFHQIYQLIGIKLTVSIASLLLTGSYWPMIWIVNKWVIYLGGFLSGLGFGALWIAYPMILTDNSDDNKAQRNMGYFWIGWSLGGMIGGILNYIYFHFQDVTRISPDNRVMVYSLCTGVTVLAALVAGLGISEITQIRNIEGRHRSLKSDDITEIEMHETGDPIKENKADDDVDVMNKPEKDNTKDIETNPYPEHSLKYAIHWFKIMGKRVEFWILLLPLIYWGFIWGYFGRMLPTATASISDKRNLIPLISTITGASTLVGSASWTFIARWTNNTFCVIVATVMLLTAIVLSILIFPKGAASEILDIETAVTYIKPDSLYVAVITALIGLSDSGISIIYYTTAGRIYGEGTSFGFSVNIIGFNVFYIISMFAPSLFDLHTYCYTMIAAVLLMCLTITVGLRNFIKTNI